MDGERPVTPRPAASVILLRGAATTLEVLLVERAPDLRFMGGAWVFPGGAVEPGDGDGDRGRRIAAVRELAEETAIDGLGPDELVAFSRWVTPASRPIRFDAHFFLAPAPVSARARADGVESVDVAWRTPARWLRAEADGESVLFLPTIRQLQQLAAFDTADAALEHARAHDLAPGGPGSPETARLPPPDA